MSKPRRLRLSPPRLYQGPPGTYGAARERLSLWAGMAAVLTAAALCFSHIHQGTLMIDSVRYAHIAKLLEQGGDWFYLYDEFKDAPYGNKPPLLFWLVALSIKLFGFSSFSVKLPAVLFVFTGLLLLWRLSSRLYGLRAGLFTLMLFGANRVFIRSIVDLNFEGLVLCGAVCCLSALLLMTKDSSLGRESLALFCAGVFLLLMAKPPYLLFILIPAFLAWRGRPSPAQPPTIAACVALSVTLLAGVSWGFFMRSASLSLALDNQILQPLTIPGEYWGNLLRWARAFTLEYAPLSWFGVLGLSSLTRDRTERAILYAWLAPALIVVATADFQSRYLVMPMLPLALAGGKFVALHCPRIRLRHMIAAAVALSLLSFTAFAALGLPVHHRSLAALFLDSLPQEQRPNIVCLAEQDGLRSKPTRKRFAMFMELMYGKRPTVWISSTIGRSGAGSGDLILAERGCEDDLRSHGAEFSPIAASERYSVLALHAPLPKSCSSGPHDSEFTDYH